MHVIHALTAAAANVAAPNELALAALHVSDHVGVVPPPAAQQVAAVWSCRCPVTTPPSGASDPPPLVLQAVVRRLVEEDELVFVDLRVALLFPPGLSL